MKKATSLRSLIQALNHRDDIRIVKIRDKYLLYINSIRSHPFELDPNELVVKEV